MVFTAIAFLQLGNAIAVRSERESVFRLGWRSNLDMRPWHGDRATAHRLRPRVPACVRYRRALTDSSGWMGAATITFRAVEAEKLLRRRWGRHQPVGAHARA
jgi:hypothetical protein